MNERIRELATQAGAYETIEGGFIIFDDHAELERFVQLIVKECISVSENHAKDIESQPSDSEFKYYDEAIGNGFYEATAAIKEHFSIE